MYLHTFSHACAASKCGAGFQAPHRPSSLILLLSLKICLFVIKHRFHSRMAMPHQPLQEVPLAQLSPFERLLARGIQWLMWGVAGGWAFALGVVGQTAAAVQAAGFVL
jgi:hypothetical protein